MVQWYLLVIISGTTPQLTVYPTEQQACAASLANPGSHIYLVDGHRDKPSVAEGECKPIQTFVTHK